MIKTQKHTGLVNHRGEPLTESNVSRFRRLEWTKLVTWCTFFYVFIVKGDELVSLSERWFFASGGLIVAEFKHESIANPPSPFYPPDFEKADSERNTDRVELNFKLLNNSSQTVLLERVEFEFEASGTIPDGISQTSRLEVSGEYALPVPNLQPKEKAVRYISTPHVLKPNDADHLTVCLIWPRHVDLTGEYKIATRLFTSAGVHELETFDAPVLSDRVVVQEHSPLTKPNESPMVPLLPPPKRSER